MPYTWIQSIASGAPITNASFDEIRDALDLIKDSPCTDHHVADNPALCSGNQVGEDNDYHNGYHPGDLSANHPGYCLDTNSNEKAADEVGHYHSHLITDYDNNYFGACSPFHAADDYTYDYNDRQINNSSDKYVFYGLENAGAVNSAFHNSDCHTVNAPDGCIYV